MQLCEATDRPPLLLCVTTACTQEKVGSASAVHGARQVQKHPRRPCLLLQHKHQAWNSMRQPNSTTQLPFVSTWDHSTCGMTRNVKTCIVCSCCMERLCRRGKPKNPETSLSQAQVALEEHRRLSLVTSKTLRMWKRAKPWMRHGCEQNPAACPGTGQNPATAAHTCTQVHPYATTFPSMCAHNRHTGTVSSTNECGLCLQTPCCKVLQLSRHRQPA